LDDVADSINDPLYNYEMIRRLLMMSAISAALIDARVKEYVDAGLFSGVVLVSQGDRVVYQVPNTTTTKFHIASVSKPITAGNSLPISRMAIASPSKKY